jgi:hypothetical protein
VEIGRRSERRIATVNEFFATGGGRGHDRTP